MMIAQAEAIGVRLHWGAKVDLDAVAGSSARTARIRWCESGRDSTCVSAIAAASGFAGTTASSRTVWNSKLGPQPRKLGGGTGGSFNTRAIPEGFTDILLQNYFTLFIHARIGPVTLSSAVSGDITSEMWL